MERTGESFTITYRGRPVAVLRRSFPTLVVSQAELPRTARKLTRTLAHGIPMSGGYSQEFQPGWRSVWIVSVR